MKKGLILSIVLLSLVGCGKEKLSSEELKQKEQDEKMLSCLTTKVKTYFEEDNFAKLDKDKITKKKVEYYESGLIDEDNFFVIVKTEDEDTLKEITKYFKDKFATFNSYTYDNFNVYFHTNQDVEDVSSFDECLNINYTLYQNIPTDAIAKLEDMQKIVVKSSFNDTLDLGTITKKEDLDEIYEIIKNSKDNPNSYFCVGNSLNLEIYDNKNKLIDTLYVWQTGGQISLQSLKIESCISYSTPLDKDIRKIIEDNTDYKFFNITSLGENDKTVKELIYNDKKYNYYFIKPLDETMVRFAITGQEMTLKEALDKKLLNYKNLLIYAEDWLIKEEKNS